MKRPLKKLIAFSTAAAALMNVPAITSSAAYVAEQVGESEYSFLMETGSGYIYSENGTADDLAEGSKLIVIGNDGTKSEITLEEGITGIYNYTSTTMGEYNYICPTTISYSFDYYDPIYRITTEDDVLIAMVGDKAALMNREGKLISDKYSEIYFINANYYEVINTDDDGNTMYGVIGSDGKEIIAPADYIKGIYLTADESKFLVYTQNSAYFTDLKGNTISDVYADVNCGAIKEYNRGNVYTNYSRSGSYSTDYTLENDVYIIQNESGYMLLGSDIKPMSDKVYDYIDSYFSSYGYKCTYTDTEGNTSYDLITDEGKILLTDCDSISSAPWQMSFDIQAAKSGSTYFYDGEFNEMAVLPYAEFSLKKTVYGADSGRWSTSEYLDSNVYFIEAGGNYYAYNSDLSKSSQILIGNETDQEISSVQVISSSYADFAVTVNYSESSENEYFCVNNDLDICRIDPDNEQRIHDYIASGSYIKDFNGNNVLEMPYDDSSAKAVVYSDNANNKTVYYVVSDNDSERFTVYDSSLSVLHSDVEGKFTSSSTYTKTTVSSDDESVTKYGWFDAVNGVVLEPIYDSVSSITMYDVGVGDVGYGDKFDENIPVKNVLVAKTEDKVALLDSNGSELISFDGDASGYSFVSGTGGVYSAVLTINHRGTTTEESSTIGYDVFSEKIVYTQTGKYDSVDTFYLDHDTDQYYAVATVYVESGDDDLWSGSTTKKALIDIDGNEVIPLSEKIGYIEYGIYYADQFGSYVYIGNYGRFTLAALDGEFAAKNGFDVAVRAYQYDPPTNNKYVLDFVNSREHIAGIYLAVKDGKFGLYDRGGTALLDREYDSIGGYYHAFKSGIAYAYYYDDDNNYHCTLIDKNGKLLIDPDSQSNITITYDSSDYSDSTFYTKHYDGVVNSSYTYSDFRDYNGNDRFNDFTDKYGYEYAVESHGLYIVSDGTNYGVVTSSNEVVIPLEYKDVLYFRSNSYSLHYVRPELWDGLSDTDHTDLIKKLDDGTLLINLKTWDNTVKAFTISGGLELGDVNGDNSVDSSDAALILQQYAKVQSNEGGSFTQEQIDAADFNHDGLVDSSDAALILKQYAENQANK